MPKRKHSQPKELLLRDTAKHELGQAKRTERVLDKDIIFEEIFIK